MYQGLVRIGQWFENVQQTSLAVEAGCPNVFLLLAGFNVVQVLVNVQRGVGLRFPGFHFPRPTTARSAGS